MEWGPCRCTVTCIYIRTRLFENCIPEWLKRWWSNVYCRVVHPRELGSWVSEGNGELSMGLCVGAFLPPEQKTGGLGLQDRMCSETLLCLLCLKAWAPGEVWVSPAGRGAVDYLHLFVHGSASLVSGSPAFSSIWQYSNFSTDTVVLGWMPFEVMLSCKPCSHSEGFPESILKRRTLCMSFSLLIKLNRNTSSKRTQS